MDKYFNYHKNTKYNFFQGDDLGPLDNNVILKIRRKNLQKIIDINNKNLCFGDKAREIVKEGITDNIAYARKLLEMV